METVDEGRVERMASGGLSSQQDQGKNDENSTHGGDSGALTYFQLPVSESGFQGSL